MTASEGGSEQEARRLDILLRSRNREGDRGQQYHQFKSVALVNNQHNINNNNNKANNASSKLENNANNNYNNTIKSHLDQSESQEENRKLSYVGLSCAVSGYSPYTAYSTDLTDIPRKVTPPAQIPVANPPHLDAVFSNYSSLVKPDYEISNNNNHVNNNSYSACNNSAVAGDRRNETIAMRQQVIHQEGHIPPSSRNGRNVDDNTHSRITNGSQNGNNRFGGGYDCTDEAQHKKASLNGKNVITSSFYQPTKTQIISGNTPTLERVTQIHTSHIQHANNNSLHASKGNAGTIPISILREGSPGSDDSGSASTCSSTGITSSSGGNLVQKQIERLYGGKERIVPVRLTHQSSSGGSSTTTSPPPLREDRDKSFERQSPYGENSSSGLSSNQYWSKTSSYQDHEEDVGGFFAKRFGIVKQKEHNTAGRRFDQSLENEPFSNEHPNGESSALDFKPLKVPAVFRLLRPEFREQLKSHSCQVQIPTENGDSNSSNREFSYRSRFPQVRSASSSHAKERIVPIQHPNGSSTSPPTVIATTTTCETAKKERVIPIQLSSGSPSQVINNDKKEESKATPVSSKIERVIPIKREGDQLLVRKNISGSLAKQLNGSIDTSKPTPPSRQAAGLSTQEVEEKPSSKSPLKPALPAKPTQTTPPKQTQNKPVSSVKKSPATQATLDKGSKLTAHSVQSPTLVANCLNKSNIANKTEILEKDSNDSTSSHSDTNKTCAEINKKTNDIHDDENVSESTSTQDETKDDTNSHNDTQTDKVIHDVVQNHDVGLELRENNYAFHEDNDTYREYEDEGMSYEEAEENYGGGIRERSLLCPILEEDGESTASTSSLIASSLSGSSSRPKYVSSVSKYNEMSNGNDNLEINNATPQIDASVESSENAAIGGVEIHDGHYFIRMLENEIFKFEEQICDFEEFVDLNNSSSNTSSATIPEDVMESILAAVGKAKLLMSQKLVQFRGLCDKNIAAMDPNAEHDPFVPTSDDLQGFWDMVYIQVEHIHTLFAELREMQSNGWKKPEPIVKQTEEKIATVTKKKTRPASARAVGKKKATTTKGNETSANDNTSAANEQNTNKKSEASKARDDARKKMMAERKKKMLELKQKKAEESGAENKNDELFVAF